MSIIEHLRQNKAQFYLVSDREISIKVVIRGFLTSTDIEETKKSVTFQGFTVRKISQQKVAMREKTTAALPKNETSNEILNLKSLFLIRINVKKIRVVKKASQCHRCEEFFISPLTVP